MESLVSRAGLWAFGRRLVGILVIVASIAAAYVALREAGGVWKWVAGVAGLSLILALSPYALGWLGRVRDYDKLLVRVADLEDQVQQKDEELSRVRLERDATRVAALDEGRAQVFGAVLARGRQIPALVAVSEEEDQLVVIARFNATDEAPWVGARYEVEIKELGAGKGIVEVIGVDPERSHARLVPVVRTNRQFWINLEERANSADPSVPPGLVLVPTSIPQLATQRVSSAASFRRALLRQLAAGAGELPTTERLDEGGPSE